MPARKSPRKSPRRKSAPRRTSAPRKSPPRKSARKSARKSPRRRPQHSRQKVGGMRYGSLRRMPLPSGDELILKFGEVTGDEDIVREFKALVKDFEGNVHSGITAAELESLVPGFDVTAHSGSITAAELESLVPGFDVAANTLEALSAQELETAVPGLHQSVIDIARIEKYKQIIDNMVKEGKITETIAADLKRVLHTAPDQEAALAIKAAAEQRAAES